MYSLIRTCFSDERCGPWVSCWLMFQLVIWSRLILVDVLHIQIMTFIHTNVTRESRKASQCIDTNTLFFLWMWPFLKGTLGSDWSLCNECLKYLPTFFRCMESYVENINLELEIGYMQIVKMNPEKCWNFKDLLGQIFNRFPNHQETLV